MIRLEKESLVITIYLCEKWIGDPQMTQNFRPRWFNSNEIPYDNMFEDTEAWLPKILAGEKVIIEVLSQINSQTHTNEVKDVIRTKYL